jgi:ketosteroid isomerase-like protein
MHTREGLQALLDAIQGGDVDQIVRHVDPDFHGVVPPSMSAEPDAYSGVEGIRRYFELFRETVDNLRFEVLEVEEHGDCAIASLGISGVGRASGIPFDASVFTLIEMRGGKMARMDAYPTLEEARASLQGGPC